MPRLQTPTLAENALFQLRAATPGLPVNMMVKPATHFGVKEGVSGSEINSVHFNSILYVPQGQFHEDELVNCRKK